jgi:hypothetical protein
MLVTGDPVTELDGAIGCAQRQLSMARQAGDLDAERRLWQWIDQRLDERLAFRGSPPSLGETSVRGWSRADQPEVAVVAAVEQMTASAGGFGEEHER